MILNFLFLSIYDVSFFIESKFSDFPYFIHHCFPLSYASSQILQYEVMILLNKFSDSNNISHKLEILSCATLLRDVIRLGYSPNLRIANQVVLFFGHLCNITETTDDEEEKIRNSNSNDEVTVFICDALFVIGAYELVFYLMKVSMMCTIDRYSSIDISFI